MDKEKIMGQVPTPIWIVEYILDSINYNNKGILKKYIMEPSFGDGVFLCEIVRRYINIAKQQGLNNKEIISDIEKYICGIEIDEYYYNICINNLNEISKEHFDNYPIKWNIYHNDTFLLYKNFIDKFDFVVGNPPYIRIHNIKPD